MNTAQPQQNKMEKLIKNKCEVKQERTTHKNRSRGFA